MEDLRVSRDGHVLTITLDRPSALNAITIGMTAALLEVLVEADGDEDVRAIVLTGAGRGFCAGADVGLLSSLVDGGPPSPGILRQRIAGSTARLVTTLLAMETPMVAAVNGPCAGAGVGLALACDVVLAAPAATFTVAFVRRGLVPDYGLTWLLPRLVGLRAARELALLGDTVPAEDAVRLGLASRLVPGEALVDEAGALAQRLAEGPGVALRLTKRLLSASFQEDPATAVEREFTAQALCLTSEDAREGVTAFLEKRPTRFVSR
jgi:2-(1,2-epoxy-1,2-dihydrophenyl)acetyl-CoA isomerase